MILQLENNVNPRQMEAIRDVLTANAFSVNEVRTPHNHYLVAIGKKEVDIRAIGQLEGVRDIHRVEDAYKLVSRKWRVHDTVIHLGDGITIGRNSLSIIAGPCSIEGHEQTMSTINHLKQNGLRLMRGGVFKPRTSPYAFRGVGLNGLKEVSALCKQHGILLITEVMQVAQVAEMADFVDIFQVGTRNAQNFNLLDELGQAGKPVMLKRGFSGTIEELLQAAEYVYSAGNEQIILCERGIRTFETAYRNTLDLNAIPVLKEKSHLPVFVDPSHGVGLRQYVPQMALAAVMAGADGVILEVHNCPERAMSDGQQTLNYDEAGRLYGQLRSTWELRKSFNGAQ
ncbi:MAG TPA: 3-deoxy-7-phosphoheptulonate synthase [Bacteroidales bacterium]|nr:3-deoxy-7-phosphoheptulonate synthase [Bacteroidales bacterium]